MSANTEPTNPTVVVNYVINAPKETVYETFLKHIWEKNEPFPTGPSWLGSTSDNLGTEYKYNQRTLLLSTITETITKLKPNRYICYTVESFLMPTKNYVASIKLTDHKDNENETLIQYSAEWECACSPAICSPGLVVFQKSIESVYTLFLKTVDDIIQKKS